MTIKKKNVTNLIRAYAENNARAFKDEAYKIACLFNEDGDVAVSEYIISLLSESTSLSPQVSSLVSDSFRILTPSSEPLFLPSEISKDMLAVGKLINDCQDDINRFIFMGGPGTGKTEAVRQLGRITRREVLSVNFSQIIDSRLGQTAKNIDGLFSDINTILNPEKVIIVFDEIDSIVLDRVNERDHREMGRATTEFFKELDSVNRNVVIIATTNLGEQLDRALVRRFDMTIDFDRYTKDDLAEVATQMLFAEFKKQHKRIDGIQRTVKKYFNLFTKLPNPGELKNSIRVATALYEKDDLPSLFSEMSRRISPSSILTEKGLREAGFTIREIEQVTGISRSSLSRKLKKRE